MNLNHDGAFDMGFTEAPTMYFVIKHGYGEMNI